MIIKSISDFTNGGSLQVNDAFVIARGGLNYYLTGQALIDATSVDLTSIQTDIALLQTDRLKLDGSNSPMTGDLSLGSNKITNLGTPTSATDASNKSYVDTNFLQITGGILTGYLTLNADPISPLQAATKQYVDAQLSGVGAIPVDTNDLPEGTDGSAVGSGAEVDGNRYYFTNQRFDNNFSSKTTDNLAEGSINKYFTTTRFNTNFTSKTTDDLLEGSINLYYTDARVRAAISVVSPLTYDSVTGIIGLNEAALKPAFGTDNQIPFVNSTNDDFDYSANLIFDGNNLALGALINSNYKLNIESSTGTIGLRSVITNNGGSGIYGISNGTGTSANIGSLGLASGSSVLNIGVRGDATSVVAGDNIGGYFYANAGAGNYAVQLVDGTETLAGGKFLKDSGNGKANWANITIADIIDYSPSALWVETTGGNIYRNTDVGFGDFSASEPSEALEVQGKIEVSGANSEFIGDLRGAIRFNAKAGEALSKGDVVYISGISGNTPVVMKADANDSAKMPAFGLAFDAASLNASVEIVTFGTLAGLNTSTPGFSLGDTLYVSTTPGQLTNTAPTGESSLIQNIGKVQRVDSNGSIKVGGAGRSNATPNLNRGSLFVGNATNQASTLAIGATGTFLKSDGSDASWNLLTEADITDLGTYAKVGTYTDGYVPRWNSTTNTLESSLIRDDGTTIGINTAPLSNVHIYAQSSIENGFSQRNTSGGYAVTGVTVGSSSISGISAGMQGNGSGSSVNYGGVFAATGATGIYGTGVQGIASISGATRNVGVYGEALNGSNNYSAWLKDGTEALGKFLKSVTSDGKANWADIVIGDIDSTGASSGDVATANGSGGVTWSAPSGGSSGVLGISDATGTYTYYSDFASAIAAASSGDTIEMFADIEETTNTTVTLIDNITINGNGHTYTLNVDDTADAFTFSVTNGTAYFNNIKVLRTGRATGTASGAIGNFVNNTIKCQGAVFISDYGRGFRGDQGNIHNAHIISVEHGVYAPFSSKNLYNCHIEVSSTSARGTYLSGGEVNNCYVKAVSMAISVSAGQVYNSTGISTNSYGIFAVNIYDSIGKSTSSIGIGGQIASNCVGISSTDFGTNVGSSRNCTFISVSGSGAYRGSHQNATIISSSNYGINEPVQLDNCYVESSSNRVCSLRDNSEIRNSNLYCKWNSTTGECITSLVARTNPILTNTTIKVTNSGAYGINMYIGSTLRYANNSFQGTTIPINTTTTTQGIVNTSDSQGNILV